MFTELFGAGPGGADPLGDNLPVIITGAFLLLGAALTGIFGLINRRGSSRSRREPTVAEVWTRLGVVETKLDTERSARIAVEDKYRLLRDAFLNYVERVKRGGYTVDLTGDEREALEETQEKKP